MIGPESVAFMMGVRVVEDELPKGWLGAYHHQTKTITVVRGLCLADPVRYRCVLGHELGHAHHGHTAADKTRGERLADAFAAALLVRLDDYLEALKHTPPDDCVELAARLGVLPWVVRAYQRSFNGGLFARVHGQALMDPVAHCRGCMS